MSLEQTTEKLAMPRLSARFSAEKLLDNTVLMAPPQWSNDVQRVYSSRQNCVPAKTGGNTWDVLELCIINYTDGMM